MTLPFLHKFLAKGKRTKFEHQLQIEKTSVWPLSLIGETGPQMLTFSVMGLGDTAPKRPGIFIYARRLRSGSWTPIYIGESANMRSRLSFNEIAADALLSGATDIHILHVEGDPNLRRDMAERLIATNRPPLNEEERIKLTPMDPAPRAPSKSKSRAA